MKTAFVWPLPPPTVDLANDVFVGTHYLSAICDIDYLHWKPGEVPDDITEYDCLIVNLFAGMDAVELIKILRPDIYVIALPDNAFEQIFTHASTNDMLFLQQLQAADAIGYVSESNRQFYGALFPDKPTAKIPMPIGNSEFFADCRQLPKSDTIITCDHLILDKDGNPTLDASVIQNVAACAAIQRATGFHVIYVNASPKTEQYAAIAGLKATFTAYLNFATYCELAAKARLGVDMYTLHGFGRNTLMYAYVGTPAVSSGYSDFGMTAVDPWLADYATVAAIRLLDNGANYIRNGVEMVEVHHSFDACRKQMTALLNEVKTWRLISMDKN